jgi:hypothetical protein
VHDLLLWMLGSIAFYAVATTLLAVVLHKTGPQGRFAVLTRSPGGRLAGWLVWMAWLIGPGYAALLLGDLSPRVMGLSQIDLGAGLGLGGLFAALSLAVLLSAGLSYRRTAHSSQPYASPSNDVVVSVGLALEAGALQWHWAFYRSAIIAALAVAGWRNPIYWGAWVAVGAICLEGVLSPFLWQDLRKPGLAERRLLRGVLLFATTVVYLLSRNFWLAWALHGLATLILEPRFAGITGPQVNNKKGR